MTEKYIIANFKCSGFYYEIISLSTEEFDKWVKFFRHRDRDATSWDDDCFEIWEYNEDNLYYAENYRNHFEKIVDRYNNNPPKNLAETVVIEVEYETLG